MLSVLNLLQRHTHYNQSDTHTHTPLSDRLLSSLLSRSSVKMLLLLLGIIFLHLAALVLLFVSTIVSVSENVIVFTLVSV